MHQIESLSSDILEQDFVKSFKPMNTVLKGVAFQRVHIEHRFATENTIAYKCYVVFHMLLLLLGIYYHTFHCVDSLVHYNISIYFDSCITVNAIGNIINGIMNAFSNGRRNSQLYVKLQKIDRELKISHDKGLYRDHAKVYLQVMVFSITLAMTSGTVINLFIVEEGVNFVCGFVYLPTMTQAIEIILFLSFIHFLYLRIDYINSIMMEYTENEESSDRGFDIRRWLTGRLNVKQKHRLSHATVNGVYAILDAAHEVELLFQFQLFGHLCMTFLWILTTIQCVVTLATSQMLTGLFVMWLMIPMSVAQVLTFFAGYLGEIYSLGLSQCTRLCTTIMAERTDGDIRNHANDIATLIASTDSRLSVYGTIDLNVRLMLKLLALMTAYTVVLLQFAFL